MAAIRHYCILIGGDWLESDERFEIRTEEKFIHLDLSGRLDRRAYALLLSTPPA